MIRPQLVIENEKVCVQIRLGQFTATVPLPAAMQTYEEHELKTFFDHVVPEMTKNIIAMKKDHAKKLRKKACRSGSTASPRRSSDATLRLLPKP